MGIKQRIASLTERQKFWATVCLMPFSPVLMLAALPVGVVGLFLLLFYEMCEDIVDQLWRWASGIPQRNRPDHF